MPKYAELFMGLKSRGEDGGKLTYVTKLAVMDIVNSGALPEFQSAILEILGYNFIQQYTDIENKTGELIFNTQWPAQLDGVVTLETKSGATDPTKGGFSFKLKPAGSKADEIAEPESAAATISASEKIATAKIDKVLTGHTDVKLSQSTPQDKKDDTPRARRK